MALPRIISRSMWWAVPGGQHAGDHHIHGRQPGGGVPPPVRQAPFRWLSRLALRICRPRSTVGGAHVLPPSDQLPDKTLEGSQRRVLARAVQNCVQDLAGVQQPDVECRGEQTVVDERMRGGDGVLVGTKSGKPVADELVQVPPGFRGVGGPGKGGRIARGVRKLLRYPCDGGLDVARPGLGRGLRCRRRRPSVRSRSKIAVPGVGFAVEPAHGGRDVPARKLLPVLGVKGPLAAHGAAAVHQDVEPAALPHVEVVHPGRIAGEPVIDPTAVRQEIGSLQDVVGRIR